MEKKLKYFGIFKHSYKFDELEDIEQKRILINKNVYIKGISELQYNQDLVHPAYDNKSQNINYIGKDFIFDNEHYTLNKDFIEEVYNTILEAFENGNLKHIIEFLKVLKFQYDDLETENEKLEFIKTTKIKAKEEYSKELYDKIFQDFVVLKNEKDFKEKVIKKHLIYDKLHLSDYVFGLANFKSFLTINSYYKFLRLTKILNFCNQYKSDVDSFEIDKVDFKSTSIPKSIAMLKASGFFELESIKKINPTKLSQIIAIIIGKDPNNKTDVRGISGNISVLKSYSEENYSKYTSHKRIDEMTDLLNKIKKGNF